MFRRVAGRSGDVRSDIFRRRQRCVRAYALNGDASTAARRSATQVSKSNSAHARNIAPKARSAHWSTADYKDRDSAPCAGHATPAAPMGPGLGSVTAVSEFVGDSDAERRFAQSFGLDGQGGFIPVPPPARSLEVQLQRLAEGALGLLLPRGFPNSVRPSYSAYAAWQFTSMTASAAAGVMSTQALLFAMGLGSGAIPLAATLNWVIKDGLGQLGGVAFSSLVNTRFDSNPRMWRMVSAISLDASVALELMSPLAPGHFLFIASVANVGKNISFLAGSASRAAIHNTLSAKGNLADVTGKAGAQNILACMIGTGAGVVLSSLLGSEFQAIVPACMLLSAIHLGATYVSMLEVGTPTFDPQRLELVVDDLHEGRGLPGPNDLAARERFLSHSLREHLGLDTRPRTMVGSRLQHAVMDFAELEDLRRLCAGLPFLLAVRGNLDAGTGEVHLLILDGCSAREMLAGCYVAELAVRELVRRGLRRPRAWRLSLGMASRRRAPVGGLLPEVIMEALRLGSRVPDCPSSADKNPTTKAEEASRRTQSADVRGGFVDATKRAGWDTSVSFLEKAGSARLRLHAETRRH